MVQLQSHLLKRGDEEVQAHLLSLSEGHKAFQQELLQECFFSLQSMSPRLVTGSRIFIENKACVKYFRRINCKNVPLYLPRHLYNGYTFDINLAVSRIFRITQEKRKYNNEKRPFSPCWLAMWSIITSQSLTVST